MCKTIAICNEAYEYHDALFDQKSEFEEGRRRCTSCLAYLCRTLPPSDELEEDERYDELCGESFNEDDYVDADVEAGEDIRDSFFHAEQDSERAMRASEWACRIDRSSA